MTQIFTTSTRNLVAAEGAACLVVSSDLPELIGLCDRVVILSTTLDVARVRKGQTAFVDIVAKGFDAGLVVEFRPDGKYKADVQFANDAEVRSLAVRLAAQEGPR